MFEPIFVWKSALSTTDLRTGSTMLPPVVAALSRCSLPVAHWRKVQAALFLADLALRPSDQIHWLVSSEPSGPAGPGCQATLPATAPAPGWFWKKPRMSASKIMADFWAPKSLPTSYQK